MNPFRHIRTLAVTAVAAMLVLLAFQGCTPKKNNAATRNYQAFITRYNIYYNGDTHYKETLQAMEGGYEDDFTDLIPVHPAEARADEKAPQPSGDFTRSIEKAQKAIQLRSIKKRPPKKAGKSNDKAYKEWMSRDEYNPFLHNAWMMMGRSQYMNGDFLGAASTFFYISRHFSWLPQTVTEAKLWQARSYCAMDWLYEAETILTRIRPEQLSNKTIRRQYALAYSDFEIRSRNYEKAIPYLRDAVSLTSGAEKTRLRYLLGQILTRTGNKNDAYQIFRKVAGSSSAPYRTKFNARIAQSEVYTGADVEKEVRALRKMVRLDRNKEYLDQIYYAIGNLYLSRRDTVAAISNYALAAEKSTRGGIEKAIAQITLGELYFQRRDYVRAQPCYAEALPLLPENYPDYRILRRRSDVLDELALYASNVQTQDSLLKLSEMTPEQQLAVVNKIIEALKKKEKEEAEAAAREDYLAQQKAAGTGLDNSGASAPNTFTLNSDKSWYFYNTATRNAGKTEFQRRWGSRKLEDNWRRRNKSSFDFNDFSSGEEDGSDDGSGDEDTAAENTGEQPGDADTERGNPDDPHFPEYYLRQIPRTPLEKATANDVIQEGLFNMGLILKDKLEDFPAATQEFDELMTRYPDNIYRLEVYYNLYLIFVREGNMAMADRYRMLIVNDFGDSQLGKAMRDPNYIETLRETDRVQDALYESAYEAYLDNRNADVHRAYGEMSEKYPMSENMPKFMFIDALSYVTENKPDEFRKRLTELLEKYPDTDLTQVASAYLTGLARGRRLHAGSSNSRAMLWDIRLGADSIAVDGEAEPVFSLNPESEQLFVFMFPTDSVSANDLLYQVARHNFTSFVIKDFDLELMNFGRLGLLLVKGFDNLSELNNYRRVTAESGLLRLSPQVTPVIISAGDFDNLLKSGRSFEDYFRYAREHEYRQVQEQVLPPELFGEPEPLPDESTVLQPGSESEPEQRQDELPEQEEQRQQPQEQPQSGGLQAQPKQPQAQQPADNTRIPQKSVKPQQKKPVPVPPKPKKPKKEGPDLSEDEI